ncbi:phage portal protein [Acidovorax citrulli]|nr:phage portal protein [Paracidovorax citrulli]
MGVARHHAGPAARLLPAGHQRAAGDGAVVPFGLLVRLADLQRHRQAAHAADGTQAVRHLGRDHEPCILAGVAPAQPLPEPDPVQAVVGVLEAGLGQHLRAEGARRPRSGDWALHPGPGPGAAAGGAGRVDLYQLGQDNLSGLQQATVYVPASEIIHDRMNCMFHPLVGVSPLFAASLPASSGLEMLRDSRRFFNQGAKPSGLLVAPGEIDTETARTLATYWNDNFTGPNAGKVAVVGDGLKYEPIRMKASDAQTKEQIALTSEMVAQVFHVPSFKVGGPIPAGQKVGDLNQIYFNDALHSLIEEMELALDEGLALPAGYRTELELDNLLRMDPATQADVLSKLVQGSIKAINEARRDVNLPPLEGGDTVYMQQQDFPLHEVRLNKLPPTGAGAAPADATPPAEAEEISEEDRKALAAYIEKELACDPT